MNGNAVRYTVKLALVVAAGGLTTMIGAAAAHATPATPATTHRPAVFVRDGGIYLRAGGHATRLTEDQVSSQPSLSPDATQVAYVHNGTVWVMAADGSGQHQISDRIGGTPRWSAGGGSVTYTSTSCTGGTGTFRAGTEGGTASEPLSPAACRNRPAPQTGFING